MLTRHIPGSGMFLTRVLNYVVACGLLFFTPLSGNIPSVDRTTLPEDIRRDWRDEGKEGEREIRSPISTFTI